MTSETGPVCRETARKRSFPPERRQTCSSDRDYEDTTGILLREKCDPSHFRPPLSSHRGFWVICVCSGGWMSAATEYNVFSGVGQCFQPVHTRVYTQDPYPAVTAVAGLAEAGL